MILLNTIRQQFPQLSENEIVQIFKIANHTTIAYLELTNKLPITTSPKIITQASLSVLAQPLEQSTINLILNHA